MTQFTTGTQVGKRKDLSSIVKDITPNDVPFLKSLSSEKAINTLFNWVDKDVTTAAKGAIAEGADVADDAVNYRTERTNYTEIFALGVEVSSSSQNVAQAGEMTFAERVADKVKMISRQKETVYLSGQAASGIISNRTTGSFQAQLESAAYVDKAVASPTYFTTMTKAFLDTALQAAYTNGADIDTVYCSPALKRALSTLLTFSAVVREAGQGKVVTDSVDIYQSDFGDVNIMVDRYMDANDILLADSSMWAEKVLTPMGVDDIAKTGLADKKLVNCESGLLHRNWLGSYAILNVKA